jgi:alpha-beta hydrolase superfamily lysophospholipase
VIYFHGNGEIVPDYFDLFVPVFEKMGLNLFLAEYRGYGMSTGNPGLASMLGDVKPIIDTIGIPHEQIILFGRSIGSLYAIHGASVYPDVGGLIIESGVAMILERVLLRVHPQELGIPMKLLEVAVDQDFNHREKLSKYKGKTLVMHAEQDSMVHHTHGIKLYDWAPEPKSLKLFPEGDHNDIFHVNAEEYFSLIYQFCNDNRM